MAKILPISSGQNDIVQYSRLNCSELEGKVDAIVRVYFIRIKSFFSSVYQALTKSSANPFSYTYEVNYKNNLLGAICDVDENYYRYNPEKSHDLEFKRLFGRKFNPYIEDWNHHEISDLEILSYELLKTLNEDKENKANLNTVDFMADSLVYNHPKNAYLVLTAAKKLAAKNLDNKYEKVIDRNIKKIPKKDRSLRLNYSEGFNVYPDRKQELSSTAKKVLAIGLITLMVLSGVGLFFAAKNYSNSSQDSKGLVPQKEKCSQSKEGVCPLTKRASIGSAERGAQLPEGLLSKAMCVPGKCDEQKVERNGCPELGDSFLARAIAVFKGDRCQNAQSGQNIQLCGRDRPGMISGKGPSNAICLPGRCDEQRIERSLPELPDSFSARVLAFFKRTGYERVFDGNAGCPNRETVPLRAALPIGRESQPSASQPVVQENGSWNVWRLLKTGKENFNAAGERVQEGWHNHISSIWRR